MLLHLLQVIFSSYLSSSKFGPFVFGWSYLGCYLIISTESGVDWTACSCSNDGPSVRVTHLLGERRNSEVGPKETNGDKCSSNSFGRSSVGSRCCFVLFWGHWMIQVYQ